MAYSTMVSALCEFIETNFHSFQTFSRFALISFQGNHSPIGPKTFTSCRDFVRQAFLIKGATEDSVEILLSYMEKLETLDSLNLKDLSEITATLLMLVTAHRLQTLALIIIENTEKNTFYAERKKVCVASIILQYLKVTKQLRTHVKNLFISTVKPHKAVTSQTISHWVKSLLQKAGIDTTEYSAYSTKHASVSAALRKGIDVSTIRRTAG